jgi:phosphoribosylamine--glycine ligase
MNVLLIGSGGREHALAWVLGASPLVGRLYCAPGNAGIAEIARCVPLDISNHADIARFCQEHKIGLVVVGPEAPLVAGLVDELARARIRAFGPSRAAAQLEGSKSFTKELCRAHGIPTPRFAIFDDEQAALAFIARESPPFVVKADGLAAGKGVTLAANREEATAAIRACFGGHFGAAGRRVVIEERLEGEEVSFFVITDGWHVLPLPSAQDHKRALEGDLGPNTGGMGAYSPAPIMTPELTARTLDEIVLPTIRALQEAGTPYRGVLYAGLMITKDGPKLIEYNVRFGDPECQALMMRLNADLLPVLLAAAEGNLQGVRLRWLDDPAICVVMAAKGYPGPYDQGSEIKGLDRVLKRHDVMIFHAGTRRDNHRLLANGGRVLNVAATGRTIAEAQARAYAAIAEIVWPEGYYRRDIGWRAIAVSQPSDA